MSNMQEVIDRHKRQFIERFDQEICAQTLLSAVNFTGIASDISNNRSQAESDIYMEMVARMILDIRESQP